MAPSQNRKIANKESPGAGEIGNPQQRHSFHRYGRKCKPKCVRAYFMFTILSSVFLFTTGIQNWTSFILVILECAFVFFWDFFESQETKKFYRDCIQYFKRYDDTKYFLYFGATESEQRPKIESKSTFFDLRMRLPFFSALVVNTGLIIWTCLFVQLCKAQCAPGDVWCYSMLLVPRIMNVGIAIYFLSSYKSVYLKKHWLE